MKKKEAAVQLRTMAFDIETYNPKGMPRPEKDEVIMISYEMGNGERKVHRKQENGPRICRLYARTSGR